METFGELLQEYRKNKKISLRSLAKELNISPTFLSDIENDRRLPPTSEKNYTIMHEICHLLNLSESENERLKLAADKSLNKKGMIAKDFEQYMEVSPKAQIAMRKAIDKQVGNKKWEEIIKILEED